MGEEKKKLVAREIDRSRQRKSAMARAGVEPVHLAEVLEAFGPKEQRICENSMIHPTVTSVLSALVAQVRRQNEVINSLVANAQRGMQAANGALEGASVQDKVSIIEDRLAITMESYQGDVGGEVEETRGLSKVQENIFQRLERVEARLPELAEASALEDHERSTRLALKRHHEKQAALERTASDDNRSEMAKLAAEVLSVASTATESISESITKDYGHMVEAVGLVRRDLDVVVESLYGGLDASPSSKRGSPKVVVASQGGPKKLGGRAASANMELASRRLRSSVSAGTSRVGGGSLARHACSLSEKLKKVLDLIDRQQERTAEVEERASRAERAIEESRERIARVEAEAAEASKRAAASAQAKTSSSTSSATAAAGGGDVDDSRIRGLRVKDLHSRLNTLHERVEAHQQVLSRPLGAKALRDRIDLLERRQETARTDQETWRKRASLAEDRYRKLQGERVKALAAQVSKQTDQGRAVAARLAELEQDCKAKIRQCKADVAGLRRGGETGSRDPNVSGETATSARLRSLEAKFEDIRTSLESSKKWNAKIMTDKIKRLAEQATRQGELVGGVASDVARLDKKYKEGLADLAKRALTARQGKQFIASEVAVLREYIERRWKEIAEQLKEGISLTKESIKQNRERPPVSALVASPGNGKYEGLLALAQGLEETVSGQSQSHRELCLRVYALEERVDGVGAPAAAADDGLEVWRDSVDSRCEGLALRSQEHENQAREAREAAAAIEDRLEGLIAFLGERLPKEGASAEVDDKLASFHRTVLKMANFDEIAIAEITKLTGRVQALEEAEPAAAPGPPLDPAHLEILDEKVNGKIDVHECLGLMKNLQQQFQEQLAHKLDVKAFLAHTSNAMSPYKTKH